MLQSADGSINVLRATLLAEYTEIKKTSANVTFSWFYD